MACISYPNTCPAERDLETTLLGKILQVLNSSGGGGGAGVSSISVNGGGPLTGAVSLTIPAASTPLLNFTDENSNADGVVWSSAGTVETFRTVGASNFVKFVGPDQRIHSTADTDRLSILGSFNKATGSFLEVAGQSHVSLASIIAGIHDGGAFSVSSAPTNSTVGTVRFSVAGTTGQVSFSDGTVGAPSISNLGDLDTGIYFPAANAISLATAGLEGAALTTSAGAATLQVFETTDVAHANFSRSTVITQAGNHQIRTEAAGTGTLRILQVGTGPSTGTDIAGISSIFHGGQSTGTGLRGAILFQQSAPGASSASVNALSTTWQISTAGHFLAGTDNVFDIGATGATRPRAIYAGTTINSGGEIASADFVSAVRFFVNANARILAPAAASITLRNSAETAYASLTLLNITQDTAGLFSVTSGANQRAGNAVLVGGTVTVANTTVTANTIVMLTRKTSGGTIGTAITYTVIAATSFTITSDSVLDTSTFSYFLIEVP